MPTVFSHPAIPLAVALGAGSQSVPGRLLAVGVACSVLPDLDAAGFFLGVPYGSTFGHRGFSHSIAFALLLGLLAAAASGALRARPIVAFAFVFASALSHGLLDAFTTGGMGIAFLSPFSNARFFFPWRPIAVAPMSLGGFTGGRGAIVFGSELLWIWLPCGVLAAVARLVR